VSFDGPLLSATRLRTAGRQRRLQHVRHLVNHARQANPSVMLPSVSSTYCVETHSRRPCQHAIARLPACVIYRRSTFLVCRRCGARWRRFWRRACSASCARCSPFAGSARRCSSGTPVRALSLPGRPPSRDQEAGTKGRRHRLPASTQEPERNGSRRRANLFAACREAYQRADSDAGCDCDRLICTCPLRMRKHTVRTRLHRRCPACLSQQSTSRFTVRMTLADPHSALADCHEGILHCLDGCRRHRHQRYLSRTAGHEETQNLSLTTVFSGLRMPLREALQPDTPLQPAEQAELTISKRESASRAASSAVAGPTDAVDSGRLDEVANPLLAAGPGSPSAAVVRCNV